MRGLRVTEGPPEGILEHVSALPRPTRLASLDWMDALKWILCALTLLCLLIPGNRLGPGVYPALFGGPLVIAALRHRQHRDFVLWCVYVLSFVSFVIVRDMADQLGMPVQVTYAAWVDITLGGGRTPTEWLQSWWYQPGTVSVTTRAFLAVYMAYYFAGPAVAFVIWIRAAAVFPRYMIAMGGLYVGGALTHVLLPTAPPWIAAQMHVIPPVFRIMSDVLYRAAPGFYTYGLGVAGGNDVAAMPSLHFGSATVIALAGWHVRRLRGLTLAYAVGMGVALVYLGEHYVVDELGGGLLALFAWHLAGRWYGRHAEKPINLACVKQVTVGRASLEPVHRS